MDQTVHDEEQEDSSQWDEGLKRKERLFVLEYCCNEETFLNGSRSYRAAFEKPDKVLLPESCEVGANRYLKKKAVQDAITKLLKINQPKLDEKNAYQLVHDIMRLATFNPSEVIDSDGQLRRNIEELGESAKYIEQIIPATEKSPTRIILTKRDKFVELALRYLNLVRPENQMEIKLPVIEIAPKVDGENAVNEWNKKAQEE